jgi:Tfp pilus assembly protein PilV
MVEAVVAVGIAILLITGLVAATTSTLRFGQMSKDRTQALQYVKEGLEVVRIIKDANWNDIPQTPIKYCLSKGQQDLGEEVSGDCPSDIDNMFSRTVFISDDGISCTAATFCRKVTVTVSFEEQEQNRSVSLTSYITNWRMR